LGSIGGLTELGRRFSIEYCSVWPYPHLSAVVGTTKCHLEQVDHGCEEADLSHQAGRVGEVGCSGQGWCDEDRDRGDGDEDRAVLRHDRLGDLVADGEQVVDLL
jgi:hypothetical protein